MQTEQTLTTTSADVSRKGSIYYFLSLFSAGAYMPFLYVYLADLGLTGEQIGLLAILSPVATLLFATPIASLADRKRWRVPILQLTQLLAGIIIFFLRIPTSYKGIATLLVMLAFFSSPIMSLGESLIARMAQRHKLNYGAMRLWGSLGFAISALSFGALWQLVGFKIMFVVTSLLYLPMIYMAGKLEEGPVMIATQRRSMWQLFRDGGFVLILAATFFSGISNSLSMTFGGIYARWLGGGNLLVGMITAFSAFGELPAMFFAERVSRRIRKSNTILLAFGLMAVGYLGYILSPSALTLPLFASIRGMGYGLWITTTIRLVTQRTPEAWAATAQSLLTVMMFGLAPLLAGPIGGWIHDVFDPAAVFWLAVGTLVIAAVVLVVAAARYKYE